MRRMQANAPADPAAAVEYWLTASEVQAKRSARFSTIGAVLMGVAVVLMLISLSIRLFVL